jgi:hypothetical protein
MSGGNTLFITLYSTDKIVYTSQEVLLYMTYLQGRKNSRAYTLFQQTHFHLCKVINKVLPPDMYKQPCQWSIRIARNRYHTSNTHRHLGLHIVRVC